MRHLWLGALAIVLAPVTAMAGGLSSFGFSIGIGSYSHGNSWNVRYSSGPSWGYGYGRSRVAYCPPPVIYQPAPVYIAPTPVYVSPAPVYISPAPVYVSPAPVYVTPAPVYVNPAPIIIQQPPVVYGPSVHIDVRGGNWSNGNGHYRYHGGSRYSYHR
jgi:hypothetical protein